MKMRWQSNERGSALLMVLLLITVFTVLGMSVLAMNLNAAKQFNRTEEKVQARLLAEMGVLHYKSDIQKIVAINNSEIERIMNGPAKEVKQKLEAQFKSFCSSIHNSNFNLSEIKYTPNSGIYTTNNISDKEMDQCTEKKITISFKSIGDSGGKPEVIHVDINIFPVKPAEGEDDEKEMMTVGRLGASAIFTRPVTVTENQEIKKVKFTFKEKVIFKKGLSFEPGGGKVGAAAVDAEKDFFVGGALSLDNHNTLNVGGKLEVVGKLSAGNHSCIAVREKFISSSDVSLGNHSELAIYGDAYFSKAPPKVGLIYIEGKLFINGIETNNQYRVKPGNDLKCKKSEEFVYPNSGWTLPVDMEINY